MNSLFYKFLHPSKLARFCLLMIILSAIALYFANDLTLMLAIAVPGWALIVMVGISVSLWLILKFMGVTKSGKIAHMTFNIGFASILGLFFLVAVADAGWSEMERISSASDSAASSDIAFYKKNTALDNQSSAANKNVPVKGSQMWTWNAGPITAFFDGLTSDQQAKWLASQEQKNNLTINYNTDNDQSDEMMCSFLSDVGAGFKNDSNEDPKQVILAAIKKYNIPDTYLDAATNWYITWLHLVAPIMNTQQFHDGCLNRQSPYSYSMFLRSFVALKVKQNFN